MRSGGAGGARGTAQAGRTGRLSAHSKFSVSGERGRVHRRAQLLFRGGAEPGRAVEGAAHARDELREGEAAVSLEAVPYEEKKRLSQLSAYFYKAHYQENYLRLLQ